MHIGFVKVLKPIGSDKMPSLFNEVGVEGACEDNICKPFFVSHKGDVILDGFLSMHLRVMFPNRYKYLLM